MGKKRLFIPVGFATPIGLLVIYIATYEKRKLKLNGDAGCTKKVFYKKCFYEKYIKRPQDFFCALLATIMLSPVMLVIAILVRIKLGSPVIFKQERSGLNGEVFTLYKFRTMNDNRDKEGKLLPDDIRLTSFGKKLRNTSLDELPELINILKGNLSVVGPRPLLVKYLTRYNSYRARRHDVRPGFTGYAQVKLQKCAWLGGKV